MYSQRCRSRVIGAVGLVGALALALTRFLMPAQASGASEFLPWMDGVWRGVSVRYDATGHETRVLQVERIVALPGGSAKLIEGRTFDPQTDAARPGVTAVLAPGHSPGLYQLLVYQNGSFQKNDMRANDRGFSFIVRSPAGAMAVTATLSGRSLVEIGRIKLPGGGTRKVMENRLVRTSFDIWSLPAFAPQK